MARAPGIFVARWLLLATFVAGLGCRSRHPQAPSSPRHEVAPPPEEHFEVGYFRDLMSKGGPRAIIDGLYVAPPSIFPSLMTGISSATPDWLDLYWQLRVETGRMGAVGTTGQLDDALARGLARNAEAVLRLARAQSEIPLAEICARTAPVDQDSADVLDGRELLGIIRRQQALEQLTDKALSTARSTCLEATRALVRRQLRIFLDSYGTADAALESGAHLTPAERQELEAVLASTRPDSAFRARRDGHLPDGPFRTAEIPRGVLACCSDEDGRIANPEGPWEFSDVMRDEPTPRARLLNACKISDGLWDITFEKGGFTTRHGRVRVSRTDQGWTFANIPPGRRQTSPTTSADDYWLDCHGLAPN
jgi:hypothetical protein